MTFRELANAVARYEDWQTLRSMRDVASATAKSYFQARNARRAADREWLHELGNEALADAEYANDKLKASGQ